MTDERIVELFGVAPHFADQRIESLDRVFYRKISDFVTSEYWINEGSVNIQDVCGTSHPDYAGMTWRELLSKGRRMEGNLRAFRRNPAYYTEQKSRLPGIFLTQVKGKTYVTDDGNHRTCIGKFYTYALGNPVMHNIQLTSIDYDEHLLMLYERAERLLPSCCKVNALREHLERSDGPGWKRDFFTVRLEVEDLNSKMRMPLPSHDALEEICSYYREEEKKPSFRQRLSKLFHV